MKTPPKSPSPQPPAVGGACVALKGLALVAELAIAAGVIYAAATTIRYWPYINV